MNKKFVCKYCKREFKNLGSKSTHEKSCNKNKEYQKLKKAKNKENLQNWISEKHKCENCGKIMTEKYSIGRFCSRACANTRHHSEETKTKIGTSCKQYFKNNPEIIKRVSKKAKLKIFFKRLKRLLLKSIKKIFHIGEIQMHCSYCGKSIYVSIGEYNKSKNKRKFCNGSCRNKLLNKTKEIGGLNKGYNVSNWEKEFWRLLNSYGIKYTHNDRNILPSGLEIDVFIPDKKLCIELNGLYHYSTKPYKGNILHLWNKKKKDIKKRIEAKFLGYNFIVFRDDKIKNKEKFFRDFIETNLL